MTLIARLWIIAAGVFLLLYLVCALVSVPRIQRDLTQKATQALTEAKMGSTSVTIQGRDAYIETQDVFKQVKQTIDQVQGIRNIVLVVPQTVQPVPNATP